MAEAEDRPPKSRIGALLETARGAATTVAGTVESAASGFDPAEALAGMMTSIEGAARPLAKRLRTAFEEPPSRALLDPLEHVEPLSDPLGLPVRHLGAMAIESDELVISLARRPKRQGLHVRIKPGGVAFLGGMARVRTPSGGERDGFLRWVALRVSPERVTRWMVAGRTEDRIVSVHERVLSLDPAARAAFSVARERLRTDRVALLPKHRYAVLLGEAPAKIVVGTGASGDVAVVVLDFAP